MSQSLLALLILIGGNVFSTLYDVVIKALGEGAPVFLFLVLRQGMATLLLLPSWQRQPRARRFHGPALRLHGLRAAVALLGAVALIQALTHLPLATASALFFSAPLQTVLLGALLFGERPGRITTLATLLGFVGVLVILRPGEINLYGILAFLAGTSLALSNLLLRRLPQEESSTNTLLMMQVLGLPVLALLAWLEQGSLSWHLVGVAALANGLLLIYQWCCVRAYRLAPASDIASGEFAGLLFAVLFGLLFFGEVPDLPMLLGALLVVAPMIWANRRRPAAVTD
ncbi:DMT family transporter [Gallaecimonas sp. GXIMD4217]|uniref:DMT family transporter n=1 Tax=Gallaecimonas sp. GXIMD4217 TaxID=3131927 RepID=UPI00311ABD8C